MSVTSSFFDRLRLAWRVLNDAATAARVAAPEPASEPAAPPPLQQAAPDAALQLLGLLQREGRLVDFLQEDLTGAADGDVANAARVVHQGCRDALRKHVELSPISDRDEGERITLDAGFDPNRFRLTGNVVGDPPFTGTLNHRGWQAAGLELPQLAPGHDLSVIAPAELEL